MDFEQGYDDPDNLGHLVKLDESTFVEQDTLNIIQKVMEYDPNLKVQYLNQAAALGDAPWRVIERCKDGEWRVIFYAWRLDDRVLERLRAADCHYTDIMGRLDVNNSSLRKQEGRRFQESIEEAGDITEHILKSPKGRYTFEVEDGQGRRKVTIDDDPKPSWKVEEKD